MRDGFIPNIVLKKINDKYSINLSNKLKHRSLYNWFKSFFQKAKAGSEPSERKVYTCDNTTNLPGALEMEEDSTSNSDSTIMNAFSHSDIIRKFYREVLKRESWDGQGASFISSVHYDQNYNNAFFDGEQMVFGDGDGEFFIDMTKSIDVNAHEDGHGIVQSHANLQYWYQSGAANESYADKFGIACEHWYYKEKDPATANWFIGDEIIGPSFKHDYNAKGIRCFKNEPAFDGDDQPKLMQNFIWTFPNDDNGAVHSNSGILNYAFYLYCIKMNQPSYGRPIQIAYKAIQNLNQWSQFNDVAKEEYKAAQGLYGNYSKAAKAVKQAYKEIGIKI